MSTLRSFHWSKLKIVHVIKILLRHWLLLYQEELLRISSLIGYRLLTDYRISIYQHFVILLDLLLKTV